VTSVLEHGRLLNESLEYLECILVLEPLTHWPELVTENTVWWGTSTSQMSAGKTTQQRKQSRRSLEWVEDNFLTQLISEATRDGALLDFLLVNREGLGRDVKVGRQILGIAITN